MSCNSTNSSFSNKLSCAAKAYIKISCAILRDTVAKMFRPTLVSATCRESFNVAL